MTAYGDGSALISGSLFQRTQKLAADLLVIGSAIKRQVSAYSQLVLRDSDPEAPRNTGEKCGIIVVTRSRHPEPTSGSTVGSSRVAQIRIRSSNTGVWVYL